MTEFLTGNEWYWRLARTVAQGVLGVLVANLDLLVGVAALTPEWRALVVRGAGCAWRRRCTWFREYVRYGDSP